MSKETKERLQDIHIRDYQPEDYQAVESNLRAGELFYEEMDSEARLKAKIKRNPGSILVAEHEGKVIGNVFLVEDGWTAFAFRLAVAKDVRGRGVGTSLMQEVQKIAKLRGYNEIHILVNEQESELQGYYEELGYEKGNLYRWMYRDLHK